jgi:vacuolar-type H+-ATPase subunit I/STV1
MARIDEIKEILNTLRIALSLTMGILVLTVGSVISRYDSNKVDELFWIGIGFIFIILGILVFIVKNISKRTKEIKDL